MQNMQNSVIIIESPNKEAKIASITGAKVFATKGHFKTLTKKVIKDYEKYEPVFEFKDDNTKFYINKILAECKNKEVIIATDPDREGYAIGYLFYEMVKSSANSIKRAEFHEITESGIKKGLDSAIPFTSSNLKEFESFKARAVSDKFTGFILSPKYMKLTNDKNLSIGRVQTPALALIVKRELEIKEFLENKDNQKIDYKIKAKLKKGDKEFYAINDNIYTDINEANEKIKDLNQYNTAQVYEVVKKEVQVKPKEPFRTSQFQEEANKKFGFSSEKSMQIAQRLFEKGLITYHRTDSNSISKEFIDEVQAKFGNNEWYERREYKSGSQSQAQAHEAIRISHIHDFNQIQEIASKESLSDDEINAYKLIYTNSLLSQAKNAINENTTYDIAINILSFKAKSTKTLYKGFKGVFEGFGDEEESKENSNELKENKELDLEKNEELEILGFELHEVKKQAPKHYKESNFISLLEKEKIGRPSTYATFLPKLLQREYVIIEKKGKNNEIIATNKGIDLIKTLKESETDKWVTESKFTALMEDNLDCISQGKDNETYFSYIKDFHQNALCGVEILTKENQAPIPPSQKQLEYAKNLASKNNLELPSGIELDYRICNEFIEKAKKATPPSPKQIELVKKLAESNKVDLPKNYENSMEICSKFIDKYIKTKK